jgi:hypothetical protein
LTLSLFWAVPLDGDVLYWADANRDVVQRMDVDTQVIEDVVPNLPNVGRLAIDARAGKLYMLSAAVGEAQGVWRSNLDGSGLEQIVALPPGSIGGLDLDLANSKVYWSRRDSGWLVERSDLDGGAVETVFSTAAPIRDLAVDAALDRVYFSEWIVSVGRIRRWSPEEGVQDIVTGLMEPLGIVVDHPRDAIWFGAGSIFRAGLDGEDPQQFVPLLTTDDVVLGPARDRLYGTTGGSSVLRVNVDGSQLETVLTLDGATIFGVAVIPEPAGLLAFAILAIAVPARRTRI